MPISTINTSSISGLGYGFKNRIINGAMGIWQRGTSSSTIGAFVADRWCVSSGTSITATRTTDVPSGFQYSLSLSGTNYLQTFQRIESLNCVDLPSQTITVSFWAKQTSGAGAASLALAMAAPTTPDNYATTTAIGTNVAFTGSASWTQYSATFTNVNSAIANGLQVLIYANTSGAATFLVTGVQLEAGTVATSFDYRPYGTELALCQRYFQACTGSNNFRMSGQFYATTSGRVIFYHYVPMRASPSLVCSGLTGEAIGSGTTTFTANNANVVIGVDASSWDLTGATLARAAYQALTYNGTAQFSAEL